MTPQVFKVTTKACQKLKNFIFLCSCVVQQHHRCVGDTSLVRSTSFSNFQIVEQMASCLDGDLQFLDESEKSMLCCFGCHTVTNGIPKIICGFRVAENFSQVLFHRIKNPRHYQLIFG